MEINTQDNTRDALFTDKEKMILKFCVKPRSKQEIAEYMGYKTIKSIKPEIEHLLMIGYLKMTVPDKPKSRNQKYVITKEH